ncbi:MAG: GspH/FimT family pseudopilin [Desulfobulbaceae bacterium]|nr:GspH/FimT family pseudopilin [Desulfobulbaceae bacterium]
MTDMNNKTRQERGFTLAELMVTVAIIAIICAIAIPAWQSMKRNSDLKNAAFSLANTIKWAKSEASKENVCMGLSFDLPNNQYLVFRDDDNGPGATQCDGAMTTGERSLPPTSGKITREIFLREKATLMATTGFPGNSFSISPRGLVSPAGLGNNVQLRAPLANSCYRLTISPSGGVRIAASQIAGGVCP